MRAKLLESTTPDGITRFIEMRAAYDRRDSDPTKNYGVHGAELVFGVTKGTITVTWMVMTDWMLPGVRTEIPALRYYWTDSVDYHDSKPHYEGQKPIKNCVYTGGDCYCDGSSLVSNVLFDKIIAEPDKIWLELEHRLDLWERKDGQ